MINTYEVVMKLIGPVDPVGETHTDNGRHENLKEMIALTQALLDEILRIEFEYGKNHQFSMKRQSELCTAFLNENNITE